MFSKKAAKNVKIENFIDIKIPEIAYFLGFLWADGYVSKTINTINIQLARPDFQSLKKVFSKVGRFHSYFRPERKGCNPSGTFWTTNYYLKNFLVKNDYLTKSVSSPLKILSLIPDGLKHYFWRGYLDGDGCIYVDKAGRYQITIAGTYQQEWKDFENLLKKLDVTFVTARKEIFNKKSQKYNRYSIVKIDNKDGFIKFCQYIYKGDKFGLNRKFKKYKQAVKQIEKHRINLLKRSVKIKSINLITGEENVFNSIMEAARKLGLGDNRIRDFFRHKQKKYKNHRFEKI